MALAGVSGGGGGDPGLHCPYFLLFPKEITRDQHRGHTQIWGQEAWVGVPAALPPRCAASHSSLRLCLGCLTCNTGEFLLGEYL